MEYLVRHPRLLPAALWLKRRLDLMAWKLHPDGQPMPHLRKQKLLRRYRRIHNLEALVETGTYLGEMVAAMLHEFSSIISIELDPRLFQLAAQRFASHQHVTILQGDSAQVLPRIVPQLSRPALFWLDGHYSGGITARGSKASPILEELQAILGLMQPPFVILIDDARLFGIDSGYPTRDGVAELVRRLQPDARLGLTTDVIEIVAAPQVYSA